MIFKFKSLFDFEKKSVFIINFFLVLLMIIFFLYKYEIKYFFYFNIVLTLFLSYFYFKKSKKLSKLIIITNMFIFFYFLFPIIADFLGDLFGNEAYIYILFYNILIAFLFLNFSGYKDKFLGNLKQFNMKIFLIIFLLGIVFGFLFNFIKEPVPSTFINFGETNLLNFSLLLVFNTFILAFSEQMIFSGFLFNVYKNLTTKYDAFFQVSIIFILFHLLRFDRLVKYYYYYFEEAYLIYLISYYILLLIFMFTSLYLYSFKGKKYSGNFFYPVILHFGADLGLFIFYLFS